MSEFSSLSEISFLLHLPAKNIVDIYPIEAGAISNSLIHCSPLLKPIGKSYWNILSEKENAYLKAAADQKKKHNEK